MLVWYKTAVAWAKTMESTMCLVWIGYFQKQGQAHTKQTVHTASRQRYFSSSWNFLAWQHILLYNYERLECIPLTELALQSESGICCVKHGAAKTLLFTASLLQKSCINMCKWPLHLCSHSVLSSVLNFSIRIQKCACVWSFAYMRTAQAHIHAIENVQHDFQNSYEDHDIRSIF